MVETKKWKPSDEKQVALTQSVVTFIAKDLLPVSLVDSSSFRELLEKAQPGFTMPSRKYLCAKLLPERCAAIHVGIKSRLQSASSVYLTMDLWSSRDMRSFMGITGHFIVGFTLQSMLACRRFYGSHTGVAIRQSYDEIVSEFEIANKVVAVVTDSASNMVKLFVCRGMWILMTMK